MYTSSTQKRHWSFSSQSELDEMRAQTNETHIARYKPLIDGKATNSSVAGFLSPREESLFCRIVTEPGIRLFLSYKFFHKLFTIGTKWRTEESQMEMKMFGYITV